jgi:hypothetical protein
MLKGAHDKCPQVKRNRIVASFILLSGVPGADPTGVLDSTEAINRAIAAASIGRAIYVDGQFRHTATINVPTRVRFLGHGALVSDQSLRSPSCFIKDFNGLGFLFSGAESGTEGVQYDSVVGRSGDNVQVTGTRWMAPSICVTNAGNDNLRIGKTEPKETISPINANLWYIGRLHSYHAGRHGLRIDHVNGANTGPGWPQGSPNCNAGTLVSADIRLCASHNLSLGNTIDNWFGNVVCQSSSRYGVHFGPNCKNNILSKCYTEVNQDGDAIIEFGASQNIVYASRASTISTGWRDNSGNRSNQIHGHSDSVGELSKFDTAPWYWPNDFNLLSPSNSCAIRQYVGNEIIPAEIRTDIDGVSGTRMSVATRTTGVGLEDKLTISQDGMVNLAKPTAELRVNGLKVVGKRLATIADPPANPTTAQLSATVTALIARLKSHGLIA